MKKTKLLVRHKDALKAFLGECDLVPDEQKAMDKAYSAAAKLVKADVEKRFPVEDMLLLKKYKVAQADSCIQGGTPEGKYIRFEFRHKDEQTPLAPDRYCSSRSIPFSDKTSKAVEAYNDAMEIYRDAMRKIFDLYKALIGGATYFEDVVEAWPATEAVRDRICSSNTALTTLSIERLEEIKALNVKPPAEIAVADE